MLFWFLVVLFKLDFSCLLVFYGLDSVSEAEGRHDLTAVLLKHGRQGMEEESKSSSRWQWIQDRKLRHRQFNFTQQNHKFLFSSISTSVLLCFATNWRRSQYFRSFDCGDRETAMCGFLQRFSWTRLESVAIAAAPPTLGTGLQRRLRLGSVAPPGNPGAPDPA